jgi:hypothetical protein
VKWEDRDKASTTNAPILASRKIELRGLAGALKHSGVSRIAPEHFWNAGAIRLN